MFSASLLEATSSRVEVSSFEDTTLSAGGRVTVTSADATLNVGNTLDISAHNTRVRSSGVVDVFAAEGTRLTSSDVAVSAAARIEVLGGDEVKVTTSSGSEC